MNLLFRKGVVDRERPLAKRALTGSYKWTFSSDLCRHIINFYNEGEQEMGSDEPKPAKPLHDRKSLTEYLIQTDIKWLVLAGKSMRYFGTGPVVAFLLGITLTYGYALFKPLPYTVGVHEVPQMISIQGKVLTEENQPMKSFEIGVLASRHGPFEGGTFNINVPYRDKYNILVWTIGYGVFKLYGDKKYVATEKGNVLEDLASFPADLGIVEGTVKNQDERAISGYVEIADIIKPIEPDGHFKVVAIPLGKLKLRVLKAAKGPVLHEEDINVQLTMPTPYTPIVVKGE